MEQELIDTFFSKVKSSSESGNESEFMNYLRDLFIKEPHAECILDKYGNLIAKVPAKASESAKPVLFGLHADTVKPGKDIEPVVEGGVISSKGETILGADDKAGIAELFEAVRTADRHPPLEIVVTRGEETGLLGSKNLDASILNSKIGFVIDIFRPSTFEGQYITSVGRLHDWYEVIFPNKDIKSGYFLHI